MQIFNSFFSEQFSFLNNSSKLLSTFLKRTDKFISSVSFSSNNIARKIPWSWYDKYSYAQNLWWVHFKTFRDNFQILHRKKASFLMNGKKQIRFHSIKKGDKQVLRNYWPASLLLICGKIFGRLVYNNLYEFFIKSDHLNHLINHVLSKVTHV